MSRRYVGVMCVGELLLIVTPKWGLLIIPRDLSDRRRVSVETPPSALVYSFPRSILTLLRSFQNEREMNANNSARYTPYGGRNAYVRAFVLCTPV